MIGCSPQFALGVTAAAFLVAPIALYGLFRLLGHMGWAE